MLESVATALIPLGILLILIASFGIIGNLLMVVVFFKFPKLRSTCHYLITVNCLGDLFHNYGQLIFAFHLFGELQSRQSTCFWLNVPTLLGVLSGSCWMLSLGIDRLVACLWPINYRFVSTHSVLYTFSLCILPFVYTAYFMYLTYSEQSNSAVTCAVPVAMGTETFIVWSTTNLVMNLITVCIYSITYFFLLKKETDHGNNFKNVFKSIFVTVALVVFGWSVTSIANSFLVLLIPSAFGKQLLNLYAGLPVNIACASNAIVFYKINTDYRNCIRKQLCCRGSQVGVKYSESRTLPPTSK